MRVFALVEAAPNGAQTIHSVFQAESLEEASAYAEQKNISELDKHVRRFRVQGPFRLSVLDFDPECGRHFLGL